MQRVLDPAQIEAFAQRTIPRIRLPDSAKVFSDPQYIDRCAMTDQREGDSLERIGIFQEPAIVRDQRSIQPQLQTDRLSITKTPSGCDRYEDAFFFGLPNRLSVCFRNLTLRIEQGSIEIQSEEFDHWLFASSCFFSCRSFSNHC